MRAVVQRVTSAEVQVGDEIIGRIGRGLLVLLGVADGDDQRDAVAMAEKIVGLRVFDDGEGKMNLALADVGGALLVVSQFTLLGDCRKGRRPNFTAAARPEPAQQLYETFIGAARRMGIDVATGRFREHMLVRLENDGPVTLWIDSRDQRAPS